MRRLLFLFIFSSMSMALMAQQSQQGNESDTSDEEDKVHTVVDEKPVFKGGRDIMFFYLANTVKYPEEARDAGIYGIVYTEFIVNKDGCIDSNSISIMHSIHPLLDEESLRVVRSMPCWEPGRIGGEAVRTRYRLPVRFKL